MRRRAATFTDGDRASGVFGVLATGFAILLGFVVFLAFTSYDSSRSGAEAEALTVAQQLETAQFLPAGSRELTGELVCYARSVAGPEWAGWRPGPRGTRNPWGAELFRTLRGIDRGLRASGLRQVARPDLESRDGPTGPHPRRRRGASPRRWLDRPRVASLIMFVYMLFFADSGERAVIVQAMLMGCSHRRGRRG